MDSLKKNIIVTDKAPSAVGTYSQGVEVNGIYYFSGQIGIDPLTLELKKSFDEELTQIFRNIDGLLESQELTRDHIIKSTIFMTNLQFFCQVNTAYREFFKAPYPARSCVQVSALPKNAQIEIEIIAS